MLKDLKHQVCEANLELVRHGLVPLTWGNASGIDRERGLVVIKPSGIPYDRLKPSSMTVVALDSGERVDGEYKPSSDTPTHLVLYRAFLQIGGIVHTHSPHATAWAQALLEIPPMGTTHADHFHGPVPCTRPMRPIEIRADYEANTGHLITETFRRRDPLDCPAVLVAGHGPFTWGRTLESAVANAVALEQVARMALHTFQLNRAAQPLPQVLLDRHFQRKHGPQAYYGQS